MMIRQNQSILSLDQLVVFAVFMFPIVFLVIRSAIHVLLFGLLLITFIDFFRNKNAYFPFKNKEDLILLATFCGLFLAVLLTQVFRQKMHMAAFDGPSRILFAGFVFLFLKTRNIRYIRILEAAIPIGLLCIFLELKLNPSSYGDGRLATYFVDSNTLGSQTIVLGILSLLSIKFLRDETKLELGLKFFGGIAGIYISIYSGSRGAWLAIPFIFIAVFIVRVRDIYSAQSFSRPKMWAQTGIFCLLLLLTFLTIFYFSNTFSYRIIGGYFEIRDWFLGENIMSAAGTRLSIWLFTFQFAAESLLFGYGEEKNMIMIIQNSPLNIAENEITINTMAMTGPHSDILSKLLSSGIIGLTAYLTLIFVPFYFFWKHCNSVLKDKKRATRIGIYYIVGIFIAGLSNEQLSLKYLCTFYGLMIATLLAQVLYQPTPKLTVSETGQSKSRS